MSIMSNPVGRNFLGNSALWYKMTIIAFLVLNPIIYIINPYVAGWILVLEFIFTLAMALKCYPLLPGGLLAIEALFLGMTSPETVLHEVEVNLPVILLLMFMVAGIYFMKTMLLFLFTKLVVKVRSKVFLSFLFCFSAAILSAFLDALTVTAVVIAVAVGFYSIYHKVASGKDFHDSHDHSVDTHLHKLDHDELDAFRAFLRSLMMHAAVGTALGGVMTLVGEPQNLLIGAQANWQFGEFFFRMLPVTFPVLCVGLTTCIFLEKTKVLGYGTEIPEKVYHVLKDYDEYTTKRRTSQEKASLVIQGLVALWLCIGLLFHLAEVGLIGLSVIVLATAFTGVTEEHQIGHAFEEALPFTALLVVFFAIVAVIKDNGLFDPVTSAVLSLEGQGQIVALYLANGVLSAISDNVFVATVYVGEMVDATNAMNAAGVPGARDIFDQMAVAINTGTNIPSVATPNGQAAFLFLLTSAVAPLVRLSYLRMVVMALPYTIAMSITGLLAVMYLLTPATEYMYDNHLINHHTAMPGADIEEGASSDHH